MAPMTVTQTPDLLPTSTLVRRFLFGFGLAVLVLLVLAPQASAGGGPPRLGHLFAEVDYLGCVDDEVDEPGIDGHALVRVRFHHDVMTTLEVSDGSWELNQEGVALASGSYAVPAEVEQGATWEQVVKIPGGTGAAWFRSSLEVSNPDFPGSTLVVLDPLGVPGNCEQPGDEVPPPTDPTPATDEEPSDVVRVTPRFTG